MNFRNLGFSFSNKKILAIVLLFASIIISMAINQQYMNNWQYYANAKTAHYGKVEGMTDCSGNNILVAILNDADIEPHKKLNIVREFVASYGTDSKLNTVKITDILNSQTDSDVVKIDKLQKKLDDMELCTNATETAKKEE